MKEGLGAAAPKKMYTTGEVAKLCGVNFRTVIRWIKRGLLRAHQLPGRGDNRIQEHDLLAFLRANGMAIPGEEPVEKEQPSVVIVENEAPVANAIQRVLRQAGFRCRLAADGFRAGALLMAEQPGLVTLDLGMPGMSGHEVLKFIRAERDLAGLKVLVISAMPAADMQKALRLGADAILEKPFTNKQLLEAVSSLLPTPALKKSKERRQS